MIDGKDLNAFLHFDLDRYKQYKLFGIGTQTLLAFGTCFLLFWTIFEIAKKA